MKTILAVTDEPELVRTLRRVLEKAGYRLVDANDGQTALALFYRERPDLILLDLTLLDPVVGSAQQDGGHGVDVCQRLRQAGDMPILVLSAHVEDAERVIVQQGCADDFVLKPFTPGQIVARIRTLLRWSERRNKVRSDVIRAGELELELASHQARVAGKPMDLTRTELTLLAALAAKPGRAFSRSQLMDGLDDHRGTSARTIDSHIKNLRAKIEPDPCHPRYILTVYGVGYKFADEV
jgi:DNA-binding response OmpR family regulator